MKNPKSTKRKDSIFKSIFFRFLGKFNVIVIPESELTTANLRIDFIINNFTNQILLQYAPYKYFTRHTIGEFKSENDFFTIGDFFALLGKLHIYLAQNYGYGNVISKIDRIDPTDISGVIIISGHKSLPKFFHKHYAIEKLETGIYRIMTTIHHSVLFILSDTILLNKYNYYLGLFTSGNFEKFKEIAVSQSDNFILTYAYILFRDKIIGDAKVMEVLNNKGYTIRESIDELGLGRVIAEVGLDRVITEVGLDQVIAEVGLDQVIAEIGLDKVIAEVGLDQVIAEIGLDQVIAKVGIRNVIAEYLKKHTVEEIEEILKEVTVNK